MSSRREFLRYLGALSASLPFSGSLTGFAMDAGSAAKPWFEISLAEWSLHKALFQKKMTNLDFPELTRKVYGLGAVEYVNQFFKDKAEDTAYLNELLKRCRDHDIKNHLIMCDGEGSLADKDEAKRIQAVDNHKKWVHAAKYLGCKTIRVNAFGNGERDEVMKQAIDGLSRLSEYAEKENINVIVENHGSYTSDGSWLAAVMRGVNRKNCGTLPDFGNFCIKRNSVNWKICEQSYDRYQGTEELMPFAKGVSAKSYDFDEQGNCIETDYRKMLDIVKKAGFKGYVGIEYEGDKLSEQEGILKTKALLEKIRDRG